MISCYDKFISGNCFENQLCHPCSNYLSLVVKKKPQNEYGRQYRCKCLSPEDNLGYSDSPEHFIKSPPRKSARSSSTPKNYPNSVIVNDSISEELQQAVLQSQALSLSRLADEASHFNQTTVALVDSVSSLKHEIYAKDAEIAKLQSQLSLLQVKLKRKQKQLQNTNQYCKRSSGKTSKETRLFIRKVMNENNNLDEIVQDIMVFFISKNCLRKFIWPALLADLQKFPEISSYFESKFIQEIKYKFRPWICLQQLDLCAAVSFRAFDIIRKIEFCEDEKQKYRRGLLPSRFALGRVCRQLENFGKEILPFELTATSVKFDVRIATTFLLNRYGLGCAFENDRSKNAVVSATVDGGELAWGLVQVSAGIKIVDRNAKDPLTGELLFGDSGFDNVQSRNHCFPLHIYIARDNKELYQTHLSSFFHEVNALEDDFNQSLRVVHGADMCSLQKTVGRGGAMKNKIHACYCCDIHRDDLCKPNAVHCSDCARLNCTQPCYHRTVSDDNWRARLTAEKELLLESYPHLQQLPFCQPSRIRYTDDCIDEASVDPMSIDFHPLNIRQKVAFRRLLESELNLRNCPIDPQNDLCSLRLLLRELLISEARYELVIEVLQISNDEDAMIRLEQALPCLLHLENRSSETIIEHLLRRGLLFREGCKDAQKSLIHDVESIVNQDIFGSFGCHSNWRFPLNSDGSMGSIKFANWRARRIVEYLSDIIDLCLPNDELQVERDKWKAVVESYKLTLQLLMQKDDFTSTDIDRYQCTADMFFHQWIDLVGYDGVTNYIHMIGAGHIRYYLHKWGNLNRFSNQGWEAYNAMIASFWHHRTRKGGGKLNRSKILPIAQWILRLMLWRTGEAQKFFQSMEDNDNSESESDDSFDDYCLSN